MKQATTSLSLQLVVFLGHLTFIDLVNAVPVPAPQACTPATLPNCNPPPEASVYICENINWEPPCYLFWLDRQSNGASYNWAANSVGSPFPNSSWTVGSWGPARGIQTTIFSQYQENQIQLTYPGLADVGPFWRDHIYTFTASWDPNQQ